MNQSIHSSCSSSMMGCRRLMIPGLLCLAILVRSSVVAETWVNLAVSPVGSRHSPPPYSTSPELAPEESQPDIFYSPAPAPILYGEVDKDGDSQPASTLVFNVDSYGAMGDGVSNDTEAFLETWRVACRKTKKKPHNSATMLVPAGKTYLVFPVSFKGPCRTNMTIQVEGRIVAPDEPSIWKNYDYQLWILITRVRNFKMTGPGIIDGRGFKWWAQSCKRNVSNACTRAPTALTFRQSKHITVHGLSFVNSQQMHLDISACNDVTLKHLRIFGPEHSPNTDGIHIERSQWVSASQCAISTGDDCVSIGPGSYNVHLSEIICGPGHGISIGSLGKKGAYEAVSNVTVERAVLRNTENGLRIKTWDGGQGSARNVVFRFITMYGVKNPIVIDQYYCDSKHSGTCKPKLSKPGSGVSVSSISYSEIVGTSSTQVAVMFRCSRTTPCHTISLKNVNLRYKTAQASSFCENAFGSVGNNVIPPACLQTEVPGR